MSSGDPGTCYSGNIDYYGGIQFVNYTGLDVNVAFVNFVTNSDGSLSTTSDGNFIIDTTKLSSKSTLVPPSLNSSSGGYTIIPGYTGSYNGMTVISTDNSYAGMISTVGRTMDSGTCKDYWINIGRVSSTNVVTYENSKGVPQTPTSHSNPLDDPLYLVPYVGNIQNAVYDPSSYVYDPTRISLSWMRILVLLLIVFIAAVVGYFIYRHYRHQ